MAFFSVAQEADPEVADVADLAVPVIQEAEAAVDLAARAGIRNQKVGLQVHSIRSQNHAPVLGLGLRTELPDQRTEKMEIKMIAINESFTNVTCRLSVITIWLLD